MLNWAKILFWLHNKTILFSYLIICLLKTLFRVHCQAIYVRYGCERFVLHFCFMHDEMCHFAMTTMLCTFVSFRTSNRNRANENKIKLRGTIFINACMQSYVSEGKYQIFFFICVLRIFRDFILLCVGEDQCNLSLDMFLSYLRYAIKDDRDESFVYLLQLVAILIAQKIGSEVL